MADREKIFRAVAITDDETLTADGTASIEDGWKSVEYELKKFMKVHGSNTWFRLEFIEFEKSDAAD